MCYRSCRNRPEWFRTYKDFFLPSSVATIQYLRSTLAIVSSKGVEIMDLESLRTMSVPTFPRQDGGSSNLAKRCEDGRTMGMFRLRDNLFLLAYDEFAMHVDKHGEPIFAGPPIIEWESNPVSVAYHQPYACE